MSSFAQKWRWQPDFGTKSGESAAIAKQEWNASVVETTLRVAKGRAIAVAVIDVGGGGVNEWFDDLHVTVLEYRCVGGKLVNFSIFTDGQDGGAKKAWFTL